MQIAMLAADFTAGEADGLRRAMAAWKRKGGLDAYHDRIVNAMVKITTHVNLQKRFSSK